MLSPLPVVGYYHNPARKSTGVGFANANGTFSIRWDKWVKTSEKTWTEAPTWISYDAQTFKQAEHYKCSQQESESAWCTYGRETK